MAIYQIKFRRVGCWLVFCAFLGLSSEALAQNAEKKDFGAGGFGSGGFGEGGFDRTEKAPPTITDVVDADGDGAITDQEARAAVAKLMALPKSKDADAKELAASIDKNGDSKISQEEAAFAIARARMQNDESGKRMDEIFQRLDENKDELVSRQEYQDSGDKLKEFGNFGRFGEAIAGRVFDTLDADRDGNINIVEAQFSADQFGQLTNWRRRREADADAKLRQQTAQVFASLDKNRDQRLTKREAGRELEANFDAIDTDGNGKLTVNELFLYAKQNAPAREDDEDRRRGRP